MCILFVKANGEDGDFGRTVDDDADDDGTRPAAGKRKSVAELEHSVMSKYAKKKEERDEKSKEKAKEKKAISKRPAAVAAVAEVAPLKRPAAVAKFAKVAKVPKRAVVAFWDGKTGKPPCQRVGDPPIDYKSARIYVSAPKRMFRVIRTRGDFNTEKAFKWAGAAPDKTAWAAALNAIDVWKPSKK